MLHFDIKYANSKKKIVWKGSATCKKAERNWLPTLFTQIITSDSPIHTFQLKKNTMHTCIRISNQLEMHLKRATKSMANKYGFAIYI